MDTKFDTTPDNENSKIADLKEGLLKTDLHKTVDMAEDLPKDQE